MQPIYVYIHGGTSKTKVLQITRYFLCAYTVRGKDINKWKEVKLKFIY